MVLQDAGLAAGAIKLYGSYAITTLKSMEDEDQTAILQSWLSKFFVCLDLMISTVPTNHIAAAVSRVARALQNNSLRNVGASGVGRAK